MAADTRKHIAKSIARLTQLTERLLALEERAATVIELSASEQEVVNAIGDGRLAGKQIASQLGVDREDKNLQNRLATMRRHGILERNASGYAVTEPYRGVIEMPAKPPARDSRVKA